MNHKSHLAPTSLHPFELKVDYAQGSFIYDTDGKPYLDLISGVGVSAFGHGMIPIKEAIQKQLDRHLHVMVYGEFSQDAPTLFAQNLCSILPSSLNQVYFVNSGAEAIECALKLVKKHTGRERIFAMQGAYHGNTHGAMSLSWNPKKKNPFRPLLPGVSFLKWDHLPDIEKLDTSVAGVFMETIQGDAGVRIPSQAYMQKLRSKCTELGILLVLDEIQCGLGRTGRHFAFEHFGIEPDILVLGKSLGGGLPIGAVVSRDSTLQSFADNPPLGHITTFGGHPLPSAAGNAALDLLKEVDYTELEKKGAYFEKELQKLTSSWRVRRIGMMFAVDCENEQICTDIILKAKDHGLLLFWFLSVPSSFRMAPPLNISLEEIDKALALFEKIL